MSCGALLLYGKMAKAFAKAFYNSKEWEKVRQAALIRDHGLCQYPGCYHPAEEVHHIKELTPNNIDDPRITMSLDNLMCVCRDCHFKIHREKILKRFQRKARRKILDKNGCYFDEAGTLQPMRTYIVYGAPASGKNTYVEQHRDNTDLVVDLDAIQLALGHDRYGRANNLLDLSLYLRDQIYKLIEDRDEMIDCRHVWVIATLPKKEQRQQLADRLRAELIHIDTSQADCIDHAKKDPKRKDKEIAAAIIEEYFEKFER